MEARADHDLVADPRRQVVRCLRDAGIALAGERVLALCSGGVDSVVLVDLLVSLPRGSRPSDVAVLHLDHGLRDGTAAEAAVRAVCARHGLALQVERVTPGHFTAANLQARARTWRYDVARRVAWGLGCAFVATGHTADDQLETLLYGLVASSGPRALLGMQLLDGDVVRPLLALSRAAIEEHARSEGLSWAEDPSNADGRYRRNSLRHAVVPGLLAAHPGAGANLARTARQLRQQATATRALARAVLASARSADGVLDTRHVRSLPTPARHALLAEWLRDAGAGRALSERVVRAVDGLVRATPTAEADPADEPAAVEGAIEPAEGRAVAVGRGCVVRRRYHVRFHPAKETER